MEEIANRNDLIAVAEAKHLGREVQVLQDVALLAPFTRGWGTSVFILVAHFLVKMALCMPRVLHRDRVAVQEEATFCAIHVDIFSLLVPLDLLW